MDHSCGDALLAVSSSWFFSSELHSRTQNRTRGSEEGMLLSVSTCYMSFLSSMEIHSTNSIPAAYRIRVTRKGSRTEFKFHPIGP